MYRGTTHTSMTKVFFLLSLIISTGCLAQTNTAKRDSAAYVQKCIAFIKEIKKSDLAKPHFLLEDKPGDLQNGDCLQEVVRDTIVFSPDEIKYFKSKQFPSLSKWPVNAFKGITFVSRDTVTAIFNDPKKSWSYFYKHYSYEGLDIFSLPIFLRNDTYCLFYTSHACGGLCGEGKLTLYKKENGEWKVVKTYCWWIS